MEDRARREHLLALSGVRSDVRHEPAARRVDRLIAELAPTSRPPLFQFDRRSSSSASWSMGHSQFAEIIGARGPNTQVNAACASTTQALGIAEDWIRSGRCKRVIVVSADDATNDCLMPWIARLLASGAAATDERVEDAATPFDRRRHGMIIGSGAAAFVLGRPTRPGPAASPDLRGARLGRPNSAFHGTRLDVDHISGVMEAVVTEAEKWGSSGTPSPRS